MRWFTILILLIASNQICFGQTITDVIYKKDQSSFPAVVDEIAEREILYFLPKDLTRKQVKRIVKSEVWKIIYANGEIETFGTPIQKNLAFDKIYLKNNIILECEISEITLDAAYYTFAASGGNNSTTKHKITKKEISKIIYANGHEEIFENSTQTEVSTAQREVIEKTKSTQQPKISAHSTPTSKPQTEMPKARHKNYFGVRIGGNMSAFYQNQRFSFPEQPLWNWEAGLAVGLITRKYYHARLEINYTHKGANEKFTGNGLTIKSQNQLTYAQGALFPIILKTGSKKLNPAIGVGGYYAYLLGHTSKFSFNDNILKDDTITQKLSKNSADYGICGMVGFYSGSNPVIELRYEYGLVEVMKELNVKNQGLSLSLFVSF